MKGTEQTILENLTKVLKHMSSLPTPKTDTKSSAQRKDPKNDDHGIPVLGEVRELSLLIWISMQRLNRAVQSLLNRRLAVLLPNRPVIRDVGVLRLHDGLPIQPAWADHPNRNALLVPRNLLGLPQVEVEGLLYLAVLPPRQCALMRARGCSQRGLPYDPSRLDLARTAEDQRREKPSDDSMYSHVNQPQQTAIQS